MTDFVMYLKEVGEQLNELDGYDLHADGIVAAYIVKQVSEMARKVGAGHLAKQPGEYIYFHSQPILPLHAAKTVIGQMQAWCDSQDSGVAD